MGKTATFTETIDRNECIDEPNNNGTITDGRSKTWFQPGNKLGGRKGGSKNRITTQFVTDLTHEWEARGCQALQELDSKALVQACIAILPKDVLVTMDQNEAVRWCISSEPLTIEQWQAEHGLTKESPN